MTQLFNQVPHNHKYIGFNVLMCAPLTMYFYIMAYKLIRNFFNLEIDDSEKDCSLSVSDGHQ